MLIVEVVSQPVVLLVKVFSTLVLLFGVVFIAGATNVSVSYTHLRAHETVLDLVCRLLLEKKTN